jgi:3-methyladenine DNA glycosylase AlkD
VEPSFEALDTALRAQRNPAVDEPFLQRYLGTPRPVLGVKTDAARALARATARALPAGPVGDGLWLALLNDLYSGPTFDHRALAGHLLHARPLARKALELERLHGWVAGLQGWCEVDTTCQSNWTAAEVLQRWQEWGPFLGGLTGETVIALRRAALVLLLTPVRESADPRLAARAFANVATLEHERDPLITKAVSWLLRDLTKHLAPQVVAYLADHAATLPAIALRETRKKLETGRK